MFTQLLWWAGNAAEVLLLVRSVQGKFYRKYPTFYFYLGSVLLVTLLRFAVFTFRPGSYPALYWHTQYFAATIGYAVILEIYSQAFKKYRGAVRVANGLLLCILAAVILKIIAGAVSGSGWSPGETMAALDRDLRALPITYLAALSIWCFTLWSYHPNPEPSSGSKIERDYKFLSEQTKRILSRARSYLKMGGEL